MRARISARCGAMRGPSVATTTSALTTPPAGGGQARDHVAHQVRAVGVLPARVAVGVERAQVLEARRAQERVAQRVQHGVAVGVPQRPGVVVELDAAQHAAPAGLQAVQVEPGPHAQRHASPLRARARSTASATTRSVGVVIFRLSLSPSTSGTGPDVALVQRGLVGGAEVVARGALEELAQERRAEHLRRLRGPQHAAGRWCPSAASPEAEVLIVSRTGTATSAAPLRAATVSARSTTSSVTSGRAASCTQTRSHSGETTSRPRAHRVAARRAALDDRVHARERRRALDQAAHALEVLGARDHDQLAHALQPRERRRRVLQHGGVAQALERLARRVGGGPAPGSASRRRRP